MGRSPLTFFAMVFALSVPFWWVGSVTDLQLMPGLSVSALMTFCPMAAALLLVRRERGNAGVRGLLKRSFDFRRITDKRWYWPVLLLTPLVSVVVYGLMRWLELPLPTLAGLQIVPAFLMFAAFFVGAVGEELGWSGYVLAPLQRRWSALQSALILGAVTIAWHLVPLVVLHRTPAWIAWWCLYAAAFRVLIVWLLNNMGGSVFAAVLFHATLNLSFMLFPVNGSHFDMRLAGLVMACTAVTVTMIWGPRTLARTTLAGRKRVMWIAAGFGILGLMTWGALAIVRPVFQFPRPTGPYAIGTLTYHWVDASRADIFNADPNARRELMAQVWYPADADPASAHAPYMADADAVMAAFAHIHDKPRFLFSQFKHVTTNAVASAHLASGQPGYPVLIFLEGVTGFRQMNTFQVEELASHGYIVVALDQPGAAANVVFPDGREVVGMPVIQSRALIRPSYMPGAKAPLLQGRPLEASSIVPFLTQDVSFALDQLATLNQADPNHVLTGRLDLQRVGTFGVSLGGIVAGEACLREARVRACLMMDAPMASDVVAAGLSKPSMWITRDAASMRLERQRAGGWPEAEIEAHQASMRAVYEALQGSGYLVRVAGTFHSNFMDVPNWTPLASRLNLAGSIDGERAHDIINAYSLAFFDRHLLGRAAKLLDKPAERYPEVLFESCPPQSIKTPRQAAAGVRPISMSAAASCEGSHRW